MDFLNPDGLKVAELGEDNVVRKKCSFKAHVMRKYDAIGFSREHWEQFPPDCRIRIKDEDTGNIFETSYEEARMMRITDMYDGFELQTFIPLSVFKQI